MKKSSSALVVAAALLVAAGSTHGAEHGFYAGASYTDISARYANPPASQAFINPALTTDIAAAAAAGTWDARALGSQGYKILAGFRALDWLAIEADYADLGGDHLAIVTTCLAFAAPCPNRSTADTIAASVSVLGMYPIAKLDLFARAGLMNWKSDYDVLGYGTRVSSRQSSGTDFAYGAGAQYRLSRVLARLEHQRLRFGADTANVTSLGVAWEF